MNILTNWISCENVFKGSEQVPYEYWKSLWIYTLNKNQLELLEQIHWLQFGCQYISTLSVWVIEYRNDVWLMKCWWVRGWNPHSSLAALLAPAEDPAGREIALWSLCLRQIVRGIAHLFYQFTDLLCAGGSHYHSPRFTRNLLYSISSDAQQNIEGHFARAKPQGN